MGQNAAATVKRCILHILVSQGRCCWLLSMSKLVDNQRLVWAVLGVVQRADGRQLLGSNLAWCVHVG